MQQVKLQLCLISSIWSQMEYISHKIIHHMLYLFGTASYTCLGLQLGNILSDILKSNFNGSSQKQLA